ncbi:MAG: hypothetical protein ABI882_02630, partial [Acidobacteriota bacterium]
RPSAAVPVSAVVVSLRIEAVTAYRVAVTSKQPLVSSNAVRMMSAKGEFIADRQKQNYAPI